MEIKVGGGVGIEVAGSAATGLWTSRDPATMVVGAARAAEDRRRQTVEVDSALRANEWSPTRRFPENAAVAYDLLGESYSLITNFGLEAACTLRC
jgi:hypothetical protein